MNRRAFLMSAPAFALVAAACSQQGGGAPARTTPVFGTFGLDTAGMDRSVAPGDDFFGYANGTWARTTEIPADRSSFNSFTRLAIQADERTKVIIEEAAADNQAEGDRRKIGDFYTAFMNENAIEAAGLTPVRDELAAIAAIRDTSGLSRALGLTLRADVDLLNATNFYTDRLFGLWVSQDFDEPSRNAPYLVQGGLGMPDRAFYLDGGDMAAMRQSYRAHIVQVLTLAQIADPEAKAGAILALETAIAGVHAAAEQTNDVRAGNNHWSQADFDARAPGIDWTA